MGDFFNYEGEEITIVKYRWGTNIQFEPLDIWGVTNEDRNQHGPPRVDEP